MSKEIVIIMGYNAAGKSTLVNQYTSQGFLRLNRDTMGGSLDDAAKHAYTALQTCSKVVLDNTYPSVKSRQSIIAAAKDAKAVIRCVHLTTSMEDAQLNACLRMVRKTGKLLMPEEFKNHTADPNIFPPVVIYKYRKEFEKPTLAEGFEQVIQVPFVRTWGPEYKNKAIIVDYDGTLRLCSGKYKFPTKPEEIKVLPKRTEVLKAWKAKGYRLLGASNQSGVAKKQLTLGEARICFEETNKMLGVNIEFSFCPHAVPPISCFCRKPNPGIGAWYIETHKLNPADCIMVGDMGSDKTFAARCGFQYVDANEFFK